MKKKESKFTLLYSKNANFISGELSEPMSKKEICKNIAIRLAIPYPTTTYRRVLHITLFLFLSIVSGGFGLLLLYGLITNFEPVIGVIFVVIMGLLALIGSILGFRYVVFLFSVSTSYIDDVYKNMIAQHNIVVGKVDAIVCRREKTIIYYQVDTKKKNYTYVLENNSEYKIPQNANLQILYLNELIHIVL